eukprot:1906265-Pyramimonas_sp.AAC.1
MEGRGYSNNGGDNMIAGASARNARAINVNVKFLGGVRGELTQGGHTVYANERSGHAASRNHPFLNKKRPIEQTGKRNETSAPVRIERETGQH